MDMRKFSGEHFIKVDDVRDGPLQEMIAGVKLGKYDKPNLVFESGNLLSVKLKTIRSWCALTVRRATTGSAKRSSCFTAKSRSRRK
jgi:hypothetical protein